MFALPPPLKTKKPKLAMRACRPRRGSEEGQRIIGIVQTLREPFGAPDISSAAKVDTKRASNFITTSLKKAWLSRSGHGEYTRTKLFPGKSSAEQMLKDIHAEIDSAKNKED